MSIYDPNLPFRHYGAQLAGDALALRKGWAPPRINTLLPDGTMVQERKPAAPCLKMLHPSGTVYEGVFGPGAGRRMPNDPQEQRILYDKLQLGHLPYGRCPKALGLHAHLAEELRDGAPCQSTTWGNSKELVPIDPDHPCTCIKAMEEIRKDAQRVKTLKDEERYKSGPDRKDELMARQAAAMEKQGDALQALVEGAVSKGGKK